MSNKSASSNSLKKTMRELLEFMGADEPITGRSLRARQEEIIADLALRAYEQGFKRGHMLSYKAYMETKRVPRALEHRARKRLAPNQTRTIIVTSKIKKED